MAESKVQKKTLRLRRDRDSLNFVVFTCDHLFTRVRKNGTSEAAPIVAGKNIFLAKPFVGDATAITITVES